MATAKEYMFMQLTIEVTALQVNIKAYRREVMVIKEALLHEGELKRKGHKIIAHHALLNLIVAVIMRRRGPRTAVHPGQQCGPCRLCGQSSAYYAHPLTWEETIKQRLYQLESVHDQSRVCKACEKDIKRHITAKNYKPCWRPKTNNDDSCIVAACNSTDGAIIHTGLVTTQQVAELLQTSIPETAAGQLTPLCQAHYKLIACCTLTITRIST